MALPYPILLTPVTEGDHTQWYAEIPVLGGMMVDGATVEEAIAELEYVKGEFMAWMLEDGDVIAEPAEFP
ncbi:MAG: type II toxin-antitoxin system HicB family antitoxin [Anaerolineae bacterium]|nr:type II toxin-antitoxin system HicB family antitoxin [Anaerolineae bacterium]